MFLVLLIAMVMHSDCTSSIYQAHICPTNSLCHYVAAVRYIEPTAAICRSDVIKRFT